MSLGTTVEAAAATDWWRSAVVYQLYIRSFADGDGDGVGDIAGIRARLSHLRDLGVDAVWINPWYPSPMADAGYDVSDYRAIEPAFGTAAEATALIAEAHALGLRVLLDIVPNHTSDQHAWFQAALAGDAAARARYLFRPGRGDGPPNDWQSVFGGPAWTQVADGSWYLHLFDPGQPDLDWTNPEVRAEFESILRFWFDHGVDGFRIDVAHGLVKADGLPDVGPDDEEEMLEPAHRADHPFWDRDGVHEIYRGWRRVADSYPDGKVFVAEAWVGSQRAAGPLPAPRRAAHGVQLPLPQRAVGRGRAARGDRRVARRPTRRSTRPPRGCCPTTTSCGTSPGWAARRSRAGTRSSTLPPIETLDRALGTRRARAAALLMLALPGSAYVYQGDELGLWEVEDLPDEVLPGPDLAAFRLHRARPRRLPRAAAVVGRGAAVRLLP